MKKFHKYGLLIVLALILALCISVFAACTPEQDTTGLTNAKAYLKAQLINEPVSTPGDYTRPSALRNEQGSYTVVWTVSITSGPQTVTIVDNGDGTVTVDVQESVPGVNEDTLYTLTATITDANGNTDTLSFNHKIPKFAINTFADYVAAKNGTDLIMEGIVTGILPKDNGATNDGYYMNTLDGEGGVYVYGTSGADLTVGQTVRVKGQKDNYSGTLELKNSTHEIINSEITAVTPVDFTAIYTAAENLKAEDLVAKQALLVTIKGVTVGTVGDNGYHYFSLAGKQSYVRISGSSCPMTTEQQTAFKTSYNAHIGYTADVTGVICVYDGKFYLTPVDENAFSNFVAPQKSDAELVADVKDSLTIGVESIFANKEIELPTAGTGLYSDVAISWELSTNACATLEANVLSVVLPEEATEITLTATISKGESTETKEFTIAVSAKPKTVNVVVDAPVNGGEYYFMFTHTNLENKNFFITGEMDTFYYATTEDITAAVKVKVIEVSAGQYQLKVGAKYLDIIANGTYTNVVFVEDAPTKNFTWNADLKTFVTVVNETQYFYGTSATKTFTTLSACKVEYASSNCIAHLTVVKNIGANIIETPVNNAEHYFMLTHTNLENKNFFITGEMDTFYYATTEDITAAVKVKVIEVSAGQYQLKVGAKYLDIIANGTYTNVVFVEDAPTKNFTWNADLKTFVTVVNETQYFYGTSATKTFTTLSACKVEYASSNCIAHLVDWVADPNASEEEEEPAETITTIEGALAGTDGTAVEISGNVTETSDYGKSFTISDGTNSILVYRPTNMAYPGDVVTVVGTLGSYQGTKQIAQGATVTITTAHNCAYGQATCTSPAKCTICGAAQTGSVALGHTSPNGEGNCDTCGAKLVATLPATISFESRDNRVSLSEEEQVWSQNGLTITIGQGTSTSTIADYANPVRIYKSHTVTISAGGTAFTQIVFTTGDGKGTTGISGATIEGGTITVDGDIVTVTFDTAVTSITFVANAQVRVYSIEVKA